MTNRRKDRLGQTCLRILDYLLCVRRPPTIRTICRVLGQRWPNAVRDHLVRLRKLGLIRFEDHKAATVQATCQFIPANLLGKEPHAPHQHDHSGELPQDHRH